MATVFTETALRDALSSGYELRFSALRGWLLVNAQAPTLRVSIKLSEVARELYARGEHPSP